MRNRDRKKMAVLRTHGRQSVTHYRVVEEFDFASRLVVTLETGRTHQIRVHLSHLGHPVFGDPTYGGRRRKYGTLSPKVMERARSLLGLIGRQALHARELTFEHPVRRIQMKISAPLPQDMEMLLHALRQGERKGGRR